MATVPIALQITTTTDKDNRTDSGTNLSAVDTKDELHTDICTWTPVERKKLQHMTEFHGEYQIPKSVREEEMQSTHLDANEVIIE